MWVIFIEIILIWSDKYCYTITPIPAEQWRLLAKAIGAKQEQKVNMCTAYVVVVNVPKVHSRKTAETTWTPFH